LVLDHSIPDVEEFHLGALGQMEEEVVVALNLHHFHPFYL
jgi:hypothetical protein